MTIKKTTLLFLVVFYSVFLSACSAIKEKPVEKSTIAEKDTKFSPLTDLEIKLVKANILNEAGARYLYSELKMVNKTVYPTKIFMEGWMLDNRYKRRPLFVEISAKKEKRRIEIDIPMRSTVNIFYLAEGNPTFILGKHSLAVLEFKDQGGVKMNLTIPR